MGMLDRILRRSDSVTGDQYAPPSPSDSTALDRAGDALSRAGTSLSRTGTEVLDRAGRFYKENPRKVQALGLLAAAALLVGVKNRGRTL